MRTPDPTELFCYLWGEAISAETGVDANAIMAGRGLPKRLFSPDAIRRWKALYAGCVEVSRALEHAADVAETAVAVAAEGPTDG